MAKFCTKCGKKLEEGQVCDCQSQANIVQQQTTAPAATPNTVQQSNVVAPATGVDIKESCMDCVNVFKSIFTKPFEAIKEFVCDNKFVAGIIMIIIAALSSGLYKFATLKSMYSSSSADSFNANDFSSLLESALSGNLSVAEPDYLKEFFTSFATNLAEYALIFVIGYIVISKLFKGTASWKQILTTVAISLSVVIVGNVINSGLVFIEGEFIANIRGYVSSFASILSILILGGAITEVAGINKNKVFISVASMSVLATVVIDIAQKLFA